MFDTRPGPLTDPKHLDEFDRIFGHGKYADKDDESQGDVCERERKCEEEYDCKK